MQLAITLLEVFGVLVVLFVAGVLATRGGEVLAEVPADSPDLGLPAGALQPEDVRRVRFGMALRGYRMREVDEVLARLAADLVARDERLMALEQALMQVVEPHLEAAERHLSAPGSPQEAAPTELSTDPLPPAEPMGAVDRTPHVDPAPDPAPVPRVQPEAALGPVAWTPITSEPAVVRPAVGASRSTPELHEPAPLWPQPDLEPEPESLLAPQLDSPVEPARDTSPIGDPPVDDSAFSAAIGDVPDDGFPEVQRADDDPSSGP